MNQTIALPALIAELAKINNCEESTATDFLHGLARVITRGLATDGEVIIKGLGTIKLIDKPDGTEVAFLPCKELAEEVNAPFALFEPVELSAGITEADLNQDIEQPETSDLPRQTAQPKAQPPQAEQPEEQPEAQQASATVPPRLTNTGAAHADSAPTPIQPGTPPQHNTPETSSNNPPKTPETPCDTKREIPADIPPVPQPQTTTGHTPTINEVYSQTTRTYTESDPPRLREERIVKVVDRRPNKSAVALAAVIALVAGLVGGYAAYEWINFKGPKNVEIKAERVNVSPAVDIVSQADSTVAEAAPADSAAQRKAEADKAAIGSRSENTPPKAVTDTVGGRKYLSVIARKHYGKDIFWVYIYEENKDRISNPNNVPEGLVVTIPPAEKYGIDPKSKESIHAAERKAYEIMQSRS